jgi:hypothetical protein
MTSKRSRIFRAVARGEPIARIADTCGITCSEAWSGLRSAIAELDRKGSVALDNVRWQQYQLLMRIVEQALAAFEESGEERMERPQFELCIIGMSAKNGSSVAPLPGSSAPERET